MAVLPSTRICTGVGLSNLSASTSTEAIKTAAAKSIFPRICPPTIAVPHVVRPEVSHCPPDRSRCAPPQSLPSHAVYRCRSCKTCPLLATPEKRWEAHRTKEGAVREFPRQYSSFPRPTRVRGHPCLRSQAGFSRALHIALAAGPVDLAIATSVAFLQR